MIPLHPLGSGTLGTLGAPYMVKVEISNDKVGAQDATIPNSWYPVPCHQIPLPRFVPDSWCLFGGGWALAQGRPIMLYRKP